MPVRRPSRVARRGGSPGGTASALVFLFVIIALLGGLYYGFHWATSIEGGVMSGMLGEVDLGGIGGLGASEPTASAIRFVTPTPGGADSAEGDPPEGEAFVAAAGATRRTHVVEAGDNPAKIAQRYGVSAQELMRANNILDPSRLRVGQELIIPESANPPPPVEEAPSPEAEATTEPELGEPPTPEPRN